jgi:hypothetical protein
MDTSNLTDRGSEVAAWFASPAELGPSPLAQDRGAVAALAYA